MAERDPQEEEAGEEEEKEFEKILALIGGRERIFLVSDARDGKEEASGDGGILQDFIRDMFPGAPGIGSSSSSSGAGQSSALCSNGETARTNDKTETASSDQILLTARPTDLDLNACPLGEAKGAQERSARRTATRRSNVYSLKRTIDSPVIVFIFRQTLLCDPAREVCVKEILKDVKARTKRARVSRPALIGLVSGEQEGEQTRQCARLLERLIRSVFDKHPPDTMWVGCFIPRTEAKVRSIKKNACKVVYASQTADNTRDRGKPLFWPFQYLFRPQRRRAGGQANNSPTSRQRGETGSIEEGIPLKTNSLSAGPPAEGQPAGGDS